MKKTISITLCIALIFGVFTMVGPLEADQVEARSEVKGLWIGYCDFYELGLYNKSSNTFRSKARSIISKAKYYGTNTIYFHVRAFDDASYKKTKFKASKYLGSTLKNCDPLQIFIEEAHRQGMELHAWMNPYRISHDTYLNPAKTSSTDRIQTAIKEVLKYDVDGIHFDDYFYHAKKYYKDIKTGTKIKASSKPSTATRRANCNVMVRESYLTTHNYSLRKNKSAVFGISPAGNVENCMSGGADVKKWMSTRGYVDYIAPQIYWTDNWGSSGKTKMYSNRLAQWKSLNKIDVPMYIGLALYRTGQRASDDKGWAKRRTNLRTHVKQMRSARLEGYILFSSADLNDSHAKKELYYLKGLVKPIYAKSIKFSKKKRTIYLKTKPTYTVKYSPSSTNPKSVTYRSSNKRVATVSSSGKIYPKKRGKTVITAKTKNGKVAKMTIYVKKFKKFKARTTTKVNVRKKATTSSKKMGTLKKGKVITIKKISKNGKWGMYKKNRWIYLPYTNKG